MAIKSIVQTHYWKEVKLYKFNYMINKHSRFIYYNILLYLGGISVRNEYFNSDPISRLANQNLGMVNSEEVILNSIDSFESNDMLIVNPMSTEFGLLNPLNMNSSSVDSNLVLNRFDEMAERLENNHDNWREWYAD